MKRRMILAFGTFSCLIAPVLPRAGAQPVPTFGSDVGLVRIDVVVVDGKGRAVTGLGLEDFEIREDGKAQAIVSFEPIVVRERQGETARPDEDAGPGPPFSPEEGRCLVVFFDDAHLSAASATRVRAALIPFLGRELRPGDRLTIVSPAAGIRFTAESPAEQARVPEMLRRLQGTYVVRHPFGAASEWSVVQAIERGGRADPRDQEIYYVVLQRLRLTLGALMREITLLGTVRGRKAILLVSEGFVRVSGVTGYDEAVALARQANATVYFMDPRGLESGLPGAEATRSGLSFSPALKQDTEGGGASYLAAATGGRSSFSNEVSALAREALEELSAYYLLGYQPPGGAPGERKLQVRVKRPGLEARHRTRYFIFGERPAKP